MRLPVFLAIALLAVPLGATAPAQAAICSASASTLSGPAPLTVNFTAAGCSGSSSHWNFGDGQTADGDTATHTFAPGAFTVTFSDGGAALSLEIESLALQLEAPAVTRYGETGSIGGRLLPAKNAVGVDLLLGSDLVAHTQTAADGSFVFKLRLESPGPYVARSDAVVSAPIIAPIQPRLQFSVTGRRIVGQALLLHSRLRPAAAGKLRLVVKRRGHRVVTRILRAGRKPFRLPTSRSGSFKAWVELLPSDGYRSAGGEFRFKVTAPMLRIGSRGRNVRLLERELVAHHFALTHTDSIFGADTLEAVYAVQKLAGLPRTGSMSAATWRALTHAKPPRPRLRGSYIEVDKTKQVLYVVRNRKVTLIVPVSTGASGNTPIGVFRVYSKVPGGAVMYYSNYFTGAFAIHGYVSVPPYPASHGCVRVPMWVAIRLYSLIQPYSRVLIHY